MRVFRKKKKNHPYVKCVKFQQFALLFQTRRRRRKKKEEKKKSAVLRAEAPTERCPNREEIEGRKRKRGGGGGGRERKEREEKEGGKKKIQPRRCSRLTLLNYPLP